MRLRGLGLDAIGGSSRQAVRAKTYPCHRLAPADEDRRLAFGFQPGDVRLARREVHGGSTDAGLAVEGPLDPGRARTTRHALDDEVELVLALRAIGQRHAVATSARLALTPTPCSLSSICDSSSISDL